MTITAWRYWGVNFPQPMRWLTHSVFVDFRLPDGSPPPPYLIGSYDRAWKAGEDMVAECSFKEHDEVPDPVCTCGIYAYKEYVTAEKEFNPREKARSVLGVVELWGNVIPASCGYRAEYAKIRAVLNSPLIATVYDVPNLPSVEYATAEFF
jgi:hypothetical protein